MEGATWSAAPTRLDAARAFEVVIGGSVVLTGMAAVSATSFYGQRLPNRLVCVKRGAEGAVACFDGTLGRTDALIALVEGLGYADRFDGKSPATPNRCHPLAWKVAFPRQNRHESLRAGSPQARAFEWVERARSK